MRVKIYIISQGEYGLLADCLHSIFDGSQDLSNYTVCVMDNYISESDPQLQLPEDLRKKITVIHDAVRASFPTEYIARSWNGCVMDGFRDLRSPLCDAVILVQEGTVFAPGALSKIQGLLERFNYIAIDNGSSILQVVTTDSVSAIGMYDERLYLIEYQEADYFRRAYLDNNHDSSITDPRHGREHQSIDPQEILVGGRETYSVPRPDAICDSVFLNKWKDDWDSLGFPVAKCTPKQYMLYPYFEKYIACGDEKYVRCCYPNVRSRKEASFLDAIVIQGEVKPVRTLAIIDQCLSRNPKALVILSTWENCNTKTIEDRIGGRFYLIKSPLPPGNGRFNRHLQRVSTYNGVVKAQSLGATHILKMRSDQLLRLPNVCDFLHTKLSEFGEERLIVGHGGTTLEERWGKFHVGDYWMFGKLHHFLSWYDPSGIDMTKPCFRPDFKDHSPEPDFTQLWMIRNRLEYSDFRDLLAERFIVLDCDSVENIFKTIPLDISATRLKSFWREHGDPLTVRHAQWLSLLES